MFTCGYLWCSYTVVCIVIPCYYNILGGCKEYYIREGDNDNDFESEHIKSYVTFMLTHLYTKYMYT